MCGGGCGSGDDDDARCCVAAADGGETSYKQKNGERTQKKSTAPFCLLIASGARFACISIGASFVRVFFCFSNVCKIVAIFVAHARALFTAAAAHRHLARMK